MLSLLVNFESVRERRGHVAIPCRGVFIALAAVLRFLHLILLNTSGRVHPAVWVNQSFCTRAAILEENPELSAAALATRDGCCEVRLSSSCYATKPGHVYSNRVPATIAQKVPITLPLGSKISTAECVVNSSPLAPSSKVDVTFCDPIKTPLAS